MLCLARAFNDPPGVEPLCSDWGPKRACLAFRQLLVGVWGVSAEPCLAPPLLPQVVFGDFLLSATSPASGGGGPMLEGVLKCGGPGEGMVQP